VCSVSRMLETVQWNIKTKRSCNLSLKSIKIYTLNCANGEDGPVELRERRKGERRLHAVAGEKNSVHAPKKKTLSRLCGRRAGEEGLRVCGGVETVWEKRHNNGIKDLVARSKIHVGGAGCRESALLGCVLGVQGVWLRGVQRRCAERDSNCFFTMGKHGNKLDFGGTEELIGGAGRSPLWWQISGLLDPAKTNCRKRITLFSAI